MTRPLFGAHRCLVEKSKLHEVDAQQVGDSFAAKLATFAGRSATSPVYLRARRTPQGRMPTPKSRRMSRNPGLPKILCCHSRNHVAFATGATLNWSRNSRVWFAAGDQAMRTTCDLRNDELSAVR